MSKIETLKKKDIGIYSDFIKEVFDYDVDITAMEKLIKKNKVLIIKKDEKIIASVILEERFEYIKNKKYYRLGYFGVVKQYRREGYASKLFEEVEKIAKENEIDYLQLTSGNQRRAAQYFYKSKNFKIKDTTVFVKMY